MSFVKSVFSFKGLLRSLQILAGIAVAYLLISIALIFWPSPEPFQDTATIDEAPAKRLLLLGDDPSAEPGFQEIIFTARDGEKLFARQYGSDAHTFIIFMHGIATDSSIMNAGAEMLHASTGANVITPDFRGHGRSGGGQFDVDYIGQYEDDLEDIIRFIIRKFPGHRVIVAGHSMGGGVAMRYALKKNAPLPHAYLLFAPNFGNGPTQRPVDDMDADMAAKAASFYYFDVRRMIGIILLNSVAIHALDNLPILSFNLSERIIQYSFRAVMSAQPIQPESSDIALQAVTSPLLVIIGSDDEVFVAANYAAFVSNNSHGETITLPGLSHDGVFSDPATYAAVRQWYKNLP